MKAIFFSGLFAFICLSSNELSLQKLMDSYSRPVTIIGLSEPKEETKKLFKDNPSSVFIVKKTDQNPLEESNCLAFSEDPSPETIAALARHEHFDIAYCFGECGYKQKMIHSLLNLSDQLLIEIHEELYDLMSNYLCKQNVEILSHKAHRFIILLKRRSPKSYRAFWEASQNSFPLMTSHHYALIKKNKGALSFKPGISLYGYKMLSCYQPSIKQIESLIAAYAWKSNCACLPWNIILQGANILWMERFPEPMSWVKEGMKYALDGLKLDRQQYHEHALKHLKQVGLEK